MDDYERFEIVAEAASLVSRANPHTPDDIIGRAVAMVASRMVAAGAPEDAFTADMIAASADHGVMIFNVGERTMQFLEMQLDGRDIPPSVDMDTPIASLALTDEDFIALRPRLTETFDIAGDDIEFGGDRSIGDLVKQIVDAMPEKDDEPDACGCGVAGCGGNTPAYKQQQDADIERVGVTLAPVLPGNDGPGFVYSIGMSEQDKTDLIFIGDYTPPTYAYLSMFLDMQLKGAPLPLGLFPADDERNVFGVPIWVIPADGKLGTHAYGVVSRLGRIGSSAQPLLAQVVIPDRSDRFPWDDGYDWIDQQAKKPSKPN